MTANRLPDISDRDFNAFMAFAKAHPGIVPLDHVLQKLIIFNFVAPLINNHCNGKILEIGCGLGFHSALLSGYGDVTATELQIPGSFMGADGNVEKGRSVVFRELSHSNIDFMYNDGKKLPFPNNSFNIVYHNSVIEHVPDIHDFNSEVMRVLKPGGIVICITGTPALCLFRLVRDYLFRFPLLIASALVRESGLTKRHNVAEQIKGMLGKRDVKPSKHIEFNSWYARLFHFVNNPPYNRPILEEFAKTAAITTPQAVEAMYLHFNSSIYHRFKYYLTPKTHGAYYTGFFHEMREWRLSQWEKCFKVVGFEIVDIVPYRFHHLLELTWSTNVNTLIYNFAAPFIARFSRKIPNTLCSEFILVAKKVG